MLSINENEIFLFALKGGISTGTRETKEAIRRGRLGAGSGINGFDSFVNIHRTLKIYVEEGFSITTEGNVLVINWTDILSFSRALNIARCNS